jgi:hypothetical protein
MPRRPDSTSDFVMPSCPQRFSPATLTTQYLAIEYKGTFHSPGPADCGHALSCPPSIGMPDVPGYGGLGTPARDFCYHSSVRTRNRLMCEMCTPSLIRNVAKAAKTASPIHPNLDNESCNTLRRSALVCIPSLPTFGDGWNSAVGVSFFRLS